MERKQAQLTRVESRIQQLITDKQTENASRLSSAAAKLNAMSPLRTLERGYSIVTRGQSTTDVVTDAKQLKVGDEITARFASGRATAIVESLSEAEEEE